jgi:GDP-L-fucose synthase
MKVIVAGSNGLAGSAISRKFTARGFSVTELNRNNANLLNFDETRDFILGNKPDILINAAAKVGGIGANNLFPVDFLMDNLQIEMNLIRSAFDANVQKFIFLGSSCIYPRDCIQPIKEEYLLGGPLEKTNSAYAIAKIAGLEMVSSYRKEFGLKWISLMPTNLYGPGDNFNLESSHVLAAFINRFVTAAKNESKSVTLWGSGTSLREFLHVDDLAEAVLIASDKYDSDLHLNVGSGEEISIKGLAHKIADAVGFHGDVLWDQSKMDGTPRKVLDSSRIKELGWNPLIGLDEGISLTVKWYQDSLAKGLIRI